MKIGDHSRGYVVYYDTANGRPKRYFDRAPDAIAWAKERPQKRPEVCQIETTTIWVTP